MPFHLHPNQKFLSRLTRIIQGALLVFLALSLFASLRTGLADNGDFTRVMTWFTSGPANMAENFPANDTTEYHKRFFNYFIPNWKLDFPLQGIFSSVELLWLPGVLLNWAFLSKAVLSMTMVGLVPRLLSLVILWLAFRWINHSYAVEDRGLTQAEPAGAPWLAPVLSLTLGIPLALLLGSGAYTVYFNSFYQETGSFIFLFLFLATVIYIWRVERVRLEVAQKESGISGDGEPIETKEPLRPSLWPRFLALAALFVLLTAKASNFYWVVPGILLVVPWRKVAARPKSYILLYLVGAAILLLAVVFTPNRTDLRQAQAFQSLFRGALTFSNDPAKRLDELGLKGAKKCVSQSAFKPTGLYCVEQFADKISFRSTAQVILHEPIILLRIVRFSAQNMQNITVELGKYAAGAPPMARLQSVVTGLWSFFKERFFPRSLGLLVTLAFFTGFFLLNLKGSHGMRWELAMLGLLATLACFIDMNVQVLGDGRADIIKHLFLANLLFDLAAIAALNVGVIYFLYDRTRITGESG